MAASKTPAKKAAPAKTQARSQDSPSEVQAEAVTFPTDPALDKLEAQRAELHKPGRASKTDAEQIDNEPGYSRDQLAHMREYWGLSPSESATEAEEGQLVEAVE